MAEQEIKYTRLPGRVWLSLAFRRPGTLWLASDHILAVIENGYSENYKRFYFTDIQGFIVRRTNRRMMINITFGSLLTMAFLIIMAGFDAGMASASIIFGGSPIWIGMIISTLRGPACTVRVRTAVQTEILMPLQRIRSFEKFYTIVRPLIVQAQGEINPSEQAEVQGLAQQSAFGRGDTAPPPSSFSPRLHTWFFATLIFVCAAGFLLFTFASPATGILYYGSHAVAFALGLGAIVRQHADRCGDSALVSLTWLAGFLILINGVIHYIEMVVYQMSPANLLKGPLSGQFAILNVNPADTEFMFWHMSIFLFLAWIVGIFGSIRAYQLRPVPAAEPQP